MTSRVPTRVADVSNSVVFVGGYGRLFDRVRRAATGASGALTTASTLDHLASLVTEIRPYAIVVPTDIHDFCGDELAALAKDVSAGIVVVADTTQEQVLVASLMDAASRLG